MKKLYTLLLTFYSPSMFVMCSDTTERSMKKREEACQEFIFKTVRIASKNPNKSFNISIPEDPLYSPLSNKVLLNKLIINFMRDHRDRFFTKDPAPMLVMIHAPADNKQLLVALFTDQCAKDFIKQRRHDPRVGCSTVIHGGSEIIALERGVQSLHIRHTVSDQIITSSIPVSDLDRP